MHFSTKRGIKWKISLLKQNKFSNFVLYIKLANKNNMEYKEENKMEQKDEVVKQIDLIEIIKEKCKHIKLY